jgi:hypothetical protein
MSRSPDLVYDVAHYLANRPKARVPLADFLNSMKDQLFIIEYLVDNGEHVITWSRLGEGSQDKLVIYDARIYDDPEIDDDGIIAIPLDQIIAMRHDRRRYNWNKLDRVFIEE